MVTSPIQTQYSDLSACLSYPTPCRVTVKLAFSNCRERKGRREREGREGGREREGREGERERE